MNLAAEVGNKLVADIVGLVIEQRTRPVLPPISMMPKNADQATQNITATEPESEPEDGDPP